MERIPEAVRRRGRTLVERWRSALADRGPVDHAALWLRAAIVIVFLWAGVLKLLPVRTPVRYFVSETFFPLSPGLMGPLVGFLEASIGIAFLAGFIGVGAVLFLIHQAGTFLPFVLITDKMFGPERLSLAGSSVPWVMDIEAIFVLKNLVMVGGVLLLVAVYRDRISVTRRRDVAFVLLLGAAFLAYGVGSGTMDTRPVGLYTADYNGDGANDLLVVSGGDPALLENTGDGFATSHLLPARASVREISTALFVDYDTDGREDLLLLPRNGSGLLLENTGSGFVPRDAGFDRRLTVPMSAAAGDYNGDGCPDVFIAQYGDIDERLWAGRDRLHPVPDNGAPNLLYEGDCTGFERVEDAGIAGSRWSMAASMVDLTGDGRPDIHVANDFNRDVLYRNRGDGSFDRRDLGPATDRNGMSSEVVDVNRDGLLDVFVTNIHNAPIIRENWPFRYPTMDDRQRGNNLLVNQGNGSFADRADRYNVARGGWGWAAEFADFDNDADPELYQNQGRSGRIFRWLPARKPIYWDRNGSTYVRATPDAFRAGETQAVVTADFDRDGDLDIVTGVGERRVVMYRNGPVPDGDRWRWTTGTDGDTVAGLSDYGIRGETRPVSFGTGGNWLQVVAGRNGTLIGTRLEATVGNTTRTYIVSSGADYRSQSTRTVHIGLGAQPVVDRLTVTTPDGTTRTLTDVAADQRIRVP